MPSDVPACVCSRAYVSVCIYEKREKYIPCVSVPPDGLEIRIPSEGPERCVFTE